MDYKKTNAANTTITRNMAEGYGRYTFTDTNGSEFRANLDTYQSENGINKMAVRLTRMVP